jgi:MscS family membrane protein
MNNQIFSKTFLGNSIESYCWFGAILLAGLLLRHFLSKSLVKLVYRFFKKQAVEVGIEDFLNLLKKPFGLFISITTIYFAFDRLSFPIYWDLAPRHLFGLKMVVFKSFQIAIISSFTWIILRLTDYFSLILREKAKKTESLYDDQLVPFIKEGLKICITLISLFFTLGLVFKLNVASLIAGLGIGGLAIALAAKESLENLLASFTIFFDKPFTVGDLIDVAGIRGNVERIGFRSTRIRTVEKSFVTVANKKLIEGVLDNITLKTLQRVRFKISLVNETSNEQIQNIILQIQDAISEVDLINEDSRVRFYEINPKGGIDILVLYFVNSSEWDDYLNVKQLINYKILDIVQHNNAKMISTAQV